jgi:hypothetical protein
MTGAADRKSGTPATKFSHLELAQAARFILTVQQSEGAIIKDPLSLLQLRYAIDRNRARMLAEQLELLGFWAVFADEDGTQRALPLRC